MEQGDLKENFGKPLLNPPKSATYRDQGYSVKGLWWLTITRIYSQVLFWIFNEGPRLNTKIIPVLCDSGASDQHLPSGHF